MELYCHQIVMAKGANHSHIEGHCFIGSGIKLEIETVKDALQNPEGHYGH